MIKPIAIALVALSLTSCITVEIPAPEYPDLPEVEEAVDKVEEAMPADGLKPAVSPDGQSTPRPSDTPLPAATVHPAKQRPDISNIVLISGCSDTSFCIPIPHMFELYERNIHLADKIFNDKYVWLVTPPIAKIERNRLVLIETSSNRYTRKFPQMC